MKDADAIRVYEKESQKIPAFAGRISELCRYIWAGSIATFFALLLSAEQSRASQFFTSNKWLVLTATAMGSFALLFDYLQNIAGFRHSEKVVTWLEEQDDVYIEDFHKEVVGRWATANYWLFIAKNVCALLTAISLGAAIVFYIFRTP